MNEQPKQPSSSVSPALIAGGLLVVAVIGLTALNMNKSSEDQTSATNTLPTTSQNNTIQNQQPTSGSVAGEMDEANANSAEARIIEVEGGAFYYKPNEIRVKTGEKVKIVMNSVDMMHDFVIDELNVKMPVIRAGNTGTVEFVAEQPGVYEFYCSVGQHRAQGQIGTLIVE